MSNILVFSVKAILHATIILVFLLQFFNLPAVFTFRLYYLYSFNCRSQRKDVYHLMIYAVICIEKTLLIHERNVCEYTAISKKTTQYRLRRNHELEIKPI